MALVPVVGLLATVTDYLGIEDSPLEGLLTRPDLLDAWSGAIYEIKPAKKYQVVKGRAQLAGYVGLLTLLSSPQWPGAVWHSGQPPVDPYYPPATVPSATLGNDVEIIPAWPGLITYYDAEAEKKDFQLELLLNLASDLVFFALFGGLGGLAALGRGLALIPQFALGAGPPPSGSEPAGTSIATADDCIPASLQAAEQAWEPAIGGSWPVSVNVVVEPLPDGRLGESSVTSWDANGRPLAGIIYLSPDAAGQGWLIEEDAAPRSRARPSLPATTYAGPGSSGSGGYDLFTALEHELGHILAFDPANPGYASHLQIVNGSQVFVGPGFSVPVAPGGELDPGLYPDDVMAATLAPGIRKLPSSLEMELVSTLWSSHLVLPVHPGGVSNPATMGSYAVQATTMPGATPRIPTTTVVDHAIIALGNTTPTMGPMPSAISPPADSIPPVDATHRKGHPVIVKSKHEGAAHGPARSSHHLITKDHAGALRTPGSPQSNGSFGARFSRLGSSHIGDTHSSCASRLLGRPQSVSSTESRGLAQIEAEGHWNFPAKESNPSHRSVAVRLLLSEGLPIFHRRQLPGQLVRNRRPGHANDSLPPG